MDKSIDALITNTFERRIREASRITAEFKAPQVTSGASGQLGYAVENNVDWDLTNTLLYTDPNSAPFSRDASFTVNFTGDGSQDFPFAIPFTDIRVNGTGTGNQVRYDALSNAWVYGSAPNQVWLFLYDQLKSSSATSTNSIQWRISLVYTGSITLRFKLRASASCQGVLSITRDA